MNDEEFSRAIDAVTDAVMTGCTMIGMKGIAMGMDINASDAAVQVIAGVLGHIMDMNDEDSVLMTMERLAGGDGQIQWGTHIVFNYLDSDASDEELLRPSRDYGEE